MKPSALMYGESTCVIKPLSCFLVSFNVNSLYRRQNAVDTIPPAPTPRTYQGKEKKEKKNQNAQKLNVMMWMIAR